MSALPVGVRIVARQVIPDDTTRASTEYVRYENGATFSRVTDADGTVGPWEHDRTTGPKEREATRSVQEWLEAKLPGLSVQDWLEGKRP